MSTIKLLLVDDHVIVRKSIAESLARQENFSILEQAGTGEEALKKFKVCVPDVVILDIKLPDINGLKLSEMMLRINSNVAILVVTALNSDAYLNCLFEIGVKGYLTKCCDQSELVTAIQTVYEGQLYLNKEISNRLALSLVDKKKKSQFNLLSNKEIEVMQLLVQGISVKGISEKLFKSIKTIHSCRSKIFEKLGVKNDVELTLKALTHGLLDLEDMEYF